MIDRILRITCQKASWAKYEHKCKVMTATAKDYIARYFLASYTPVQDTDIELMMWQDYQDHRKQIADQAKAKRPLRGEVMDAATFEEFLKGVSK